MAERTYIAIDLKSFYASSECAELGFDPLSTNLVVADQSRTDKTICLAVSPSLKAYGLPGRARLFEVKAKLKEVNATRLAAAPGGALRGESYDANALAADPNLAAGVYIAKPRMSHYLNVSAKIYGIYLRYVSEADIHVYSVDEVFMDVTGYLRAYGRSAHDMAREMIQRILRETGITATAGIGTNMYLAKVAMDVVAKHIPADKDGVRIAYKPAGHSMSSGQVLTGAVGFDSARLIVREMADTLSLDLVAKGMRAGRVGMMIGYDTASLDPKRLGKDAPAELKTIAERAAATYDGPVSLDRYGRRVPKPATGSIALSGPTSATSRICDAVDELFCSIVDRRLLVRRLNVVAADLLTADQFAQRRQSDMSEYMQPDLFDALNSSSDSSIADAAGDEGPHDNAFLGCSQNNSSERPSSGASCDDAELHMQQTLLNIKRKFGKNSVIKAMDMFDDATGRQRNQQIGGHAA